VTSARTRPPPQGFVTAKSGKCICDPINAGPGCCFCVTPGTCGPQLTDAQALLAYEVRPPDADAAGRRACCGGASRVPAQLLRLRAHGGRPGCACRLAAALCR